MKPTPTSLKPSTFNRDVIDTPATAVLAAQPTPTARQWSPYQQAIFDFIQAGRGSAVVIAVAGSGKTTTIVEAAKRLMSDPKFGLLASSNRFSATFVAFNKSIADELKLRLPGSVRAQTLNSLGFGAWRRHIGDDANSLKLDTNKTRQLTQEVIPPQHFGLFSKSMSRIIGICKASGVVPGTTLNGEYKGLIEDEDEVYRDIVETFGLDMEADMDNPAHVAQLATYCRAILTKSISLSHKLIDFDDQLYMPVIAGTRFWQNDLVFVDEAQDLNRIQRVMIRRALKGNGRLIAVGDPNQAIYGFRGADTSSIDNIKQEFDARELPLTISYRCPRAVVAEAHNWVSHIQSHESAAEGSVRTMDKFTADYFRSTDIVVCRNTRPLIELAFNILREGVPCKVRGRDIGAGLVALVKKFKTNDMETFQAKFDAYVTKKVNAWMVEQKEDLAGRLQDQYDTIQVFCESLDADATVDDLVRKIESMFSDNGPQILTLSTIHKAKGLEFPRVFVLDAHLMPSKYAKTKEQKQQESNLQYVAVTRAQADLLYINSDRFRPGKGKEAQ